MFEKSIKIINFITTQLIRVDCTLMRDYFERLKQLNGECNTST